MPRPQIFLIDGSSQMYRAYHAFRGKGLSNQEGQSTHAVYVFVTMLRKLIADHAPPLIAASFDLAGPTFRNELAERLQGQPRGDARRPGRADGVGARGVRGDGRADPDRRRATRPTTCSGRWRAGRWRPASTWRSCRSTRTSSSWSATHVRVYDPREDGAVVRRRRREGEVRRRAGAGRGRAGARRATRATTWPACPASARRARSI